MLNFGLIKIDFWPRSTFYAITELKIKSNIFIHHYQIVNNIPAETKDVHASSFNYISHIRSYSRWQ